MADWIDASGREDRPPPPPELALYFKVRDGGDPWGAGWMTWPAGMLDRLRMARNVFEAWSSYARAEDRVAWSKAEKNASANGVVGVVKSYRYGAEEELTVVERWEKWN